MTPEQALAEAQSGKLRPIYLIVGEEPYWVAQVGTALRRAALLGAVPGLNEEVLNAAERDVNAVLAAARTLPMMAKRRLVLVQRVEAWEPKGGADAGDEGRGKGLDAFERLVEYAKGPSPSTVLLLVGGPLDKRRKLVTTARNEGWLVQCDPLARADLPGFVARTARARETQLAEGVADLIAELAGPDLGSVADAIERLSLYAGGAIVTEDMVADCVVRLRTKTVWELVNAVGRRDSAAALAAIHDVFDPSESIRLVGLLAWSARQLIRFEAALRAGSSPPEAAQRAGAPPFKARELQQQLKGVPAGALPGWLVTLADMDRALKGGSKLPPKAIMEHGVLALCRA